MKLLDVPAAIRLIVGGLNWGLVTFFNFDLVAAITGAGDFGNKNTFGVVVYALVFLTAIYSLVTLGKRKVKSMS